MSPSLTSGRSATAFSITSTADTPEYEPVIPDPLTVRTSAFHPARRFFGPSIEQRATLRWSEIAAARNKIVHLQMQIAPRTLAPPRDEHRRAHALRPRGACEEPPGSLPTGQQSQRCY
jgi:hypothetical protein